MAIIGGLFIFGRSPAYYRISDDSLGLAFEMSQDFERIPPVELQSRNPAFVYGFRPKQIDDVSCIISQTTRPKSGPVSVEYLVQGTFAAIKKNYPDVHADVSKKVLVGGREGAWLELSYQDGSKSVQQLELVLTTDERTTFAFCTVPAPLLPLYKEKFQHFLGSVRVN